MSLWPPLIADIYVKLEVEKTEFHVHIDHYFLIKQIELSLTRKLINSKIELGSLTSEHSEFPIEVAAPEIVENTHDMWSDDRSLKLHGILKAYHMA